MQKNISIDSHTKAKLINFKIRHNYRSFNEAIELLLSQNKGKLIISPEIEKIFREFCLEENYQTENKGIKVLLERYYKYGLPNLSSEELINNYFKNYDLLVQNLKKERGNHKRKEMINQLRELIQLLEGEL